MWLIRNNKNKHMKVAIFGRYYSVTTPKSVEIIEQSDAIQSLAPEYSDLAISKMFENAGMEDIDKNRYKSQIRSLQKGIEVAITTSIVSIEFIDGTKLV